jgi:anaerobic magnesium-protoporphyrin IX monomethyl ester cyclase
MKILLIAPATPNPAPSYFGPPYALAMFGAMLQAEGHTVVAVDLSREEESVMTARLVDILNDERPDLVGITCLGVNRGITVRAVRQIKSLSEDIKVIVGGAYPTNSPMEFFERSPVDFVCVGDGEHTLMELVSALDKAQPLSAIQGLLFREEGTVVRNPPRPEFEDLDSLPFPDLDLFDVEKPLVEFARTDRDQALATAGMPGRMGYQANAALMVIGSRGCVFRCSFCPMSLKKPRVRTHSPAYTADLMVYYRDKYGIRDFVMGDNLFSHPRDRAIGLCEALIERNADLSWICMTRVDMVDEELLAKMAQAGCKEISFGVETLAWEVQKAMKKNLRCAPIVDVYQMVHNAGIQSNLMLMIGNEGETRRTVRANAAGCRDIGPDRILLNTTKVYAGTDLFKRAVEKGMFEPEYFALEDPDVREYTAEFSVAELRVMEGMLRHRTMYVSAADLLARGLGGASIGPALKRAMAVLDLRAEESVVDIRGMESVPALVPLLVQSKASRAKRLWLHGDPAFLAKNSHRRQVQSANASRGFIVPMFSMNPAHHDDIVGREGALDATRKGLINWTHGGGRARVWAYLDKYNVADVPRWVAWLSEHRVSSVLFIVGSDPVGWARVNPERMPAMAEAGAALMRGLQVAESLGIEMEITGLPECFLDADPIALHEQWRPFDEQMDVEDVPSPTASKRMADKHFTAACEACDVRHHCEGIWNFVPHEDTQVRPIDPPQSDDIGEIDEICAR